jgi:hypothetical protein
MSEIIRPGLPCVTPQSIPVPERWTSSGLSLIISDEDRTSLQLLTTRGGVTYFLLVGRDGQMGPFLSALNHHFDVDNIADRDMGRNEWVKSV